MSVIQQSYDFSHLCLLTIELMVNKLLIQLNENSSILIQNKIMWLSQKENEKNKEKFYIPTRKYGPNRGLLLAFGDVFVSGPRLKWHYSSFTCMYFRVNLGLNNLDIYLLLYVVSVVFSKFGSKLSICSFSKGSL